MPLLPLRPLPVNDAHDGHFGVRMAATDHSALLVVRRNADSVCWKSRLHSLEEILAPSQPLRTLDIVAVATCIYHGVAYDALATVLYAAPALQLHRREVAFNPVGDEDSYLLTVKITVRSSSAGAGSSVSGSARSTPSARAISVEHTAPSAPPLDDGVDSVEGSMNGMGSVDDDVPVVEVSEEDVLLMIPFTRMQSDAMSLDAETIRESTAQSKPFVRCEAVGVAFANACLNWRIAWSGSLLGTVSGASLSVYPLQDGLKLSRAGKYEITLRLTHVGHAQPVLFVLNAGGVMAAPVGMVTHASGAHGGLGCTVASFQIKFAGPNVLRVQLLPGSAPVCEPSVLTIREYVPVSI